MPSLGLLLFRCPAPIIISMISLIDPFVGIEIEYFMHLTLFVFIDYNMPEQISKEFDYITIAKQKYLIC